MRSQHNENEAKQEIQEKKYTTFHINVRHILLVLAFFGISSIGVLASSISIVIIAMVNMTSAIEQNMTTISNCSGQLNETSTQTAMGAGDFHWNTAQQGLILGSIFYGCSVMNIPGAWFAKKIGAKRVIGYSFLLCGILTILSPIIALTSFELFVLLRIILGVFLGIAYPAIIGMWNSWAPPAERTFFLSVTLAGNSFGFFLSLTLVGYIAGTAGWQMSFYVTGGFVLFWTFCWFVLMYDTPSQHPWISKKEKEFIITSIGNSKQNRKKVITPWASIFTSVPMWSIICAHFASNWAEYTINSLLPIYMATQLNFKLTSIGLLISLPYMLQVVITMIIGYITDVIRRRKIVTTLAIRKINTSVGLLLPGAFGIIAMYIGCNTEGAVACFCLAIAFAPFVVSGFKSCTADIAPQFGGITYALSNTFAVIPAFLVPQIGGMILLNGNGRLQWQIIFWISAGLSTLGQIIFITFGSADEQPWAKTGTAEDKENIDDASLIN